MTETSAAPLALDPELARWLERAEALAWSRDCFAAAEAAPGDPAGARLRAVGDGWASALTAIDDGFFNRAVGIGSDGPATEPAIEAASSFFTELGRTTSVMQIAPPRITTEVSDWLGARAYRPGRSWVKLWHDLADLPTATTALSVERIDRSSAADFERIVLAAFGLPDVVGTVATAVVGRPGWTHYLASDGGTPVSAAAMYVTEGVAWLGFGATLEAARGRGGQSALFARRLQDARDLGCRWAVTETGEETDDDPNPSYRNMIRAGFKLAYARRNWVRIEGGPA
jgi:GNAT superfamily N-acetyltransferase